MGWRAAIREILKLWTDGPFTDDWATREPDPKLSPELHRNWLAAHERRQSDD
jgi:hypothetical protein